MDTQRNSGGKTPVFALAYCHRDADAARRWLAWAGFLACEAGPAVRHDLVVMADEIYEKIIFDDAVHHHAATFAGEDVLCLTFSGLSKAYRVCGYRAGWVMVASGPGGT